MGGSSTPANTTQTSRVELSEQQKQLYSMVLPVIQAYLKNPPSSPNTPFMVPRSGLANAAETSLLGTVLDPATARGVTGRLDAERGQLESQLGALLMQAKTDRGQYLGAM